MRCLGVKNPLLPKSLKPLMLHNICTTSSRLKEVVDWIPHKTIRSIYPPPSIPVTNKGLCWNFPLKWQHVILVVTQESCVHPKLSIKLHRFPLVRRNPKDFYRQFSENPIYTLYSGYLLGPNPLLEGSLGEVHQLIGSPSQKFPPCSLWQKVW